ncbi:MAG: hypothetical protein ACM3US_07255 [Sphingomonadaceae bacterium]
MARQAGYVVVATTQTGELVELYRTPHRPVAKAVATGIRNAGVVARVLPADRVTRVNNPARR